MPAPAIQPNDEFLAAVDELGVAFEPGDLDRLAQYLNILRRTNEQFNLTAITEPQAMWMRHVYDSLTLIPYLVSVEAKTVIDVGSGGGLPGIPLAIALPDINFTLLEATGKKARFLETVGDDLGLANVAVVNDRAETVGQDPDYREKYDVAVARAVGGLAVVLELAVPLVTVSDSSCGYVLAIKGERAAEEIAEAKHALHKLHCHWVESHRTTTGTIVVIEKHCKTPRTYPRRPGEPKRVPL